ncbi:N2227-like protein-domain-containing protein [Chaetomidium leptoderma]|uniref:N2227-like protein-domain-containing protein n=1 Tax=Chaetomidium leptoderma TaxID=669021 RepID=A0AAN6VCF3_9PEZI|nr:N2227-like protein-domain-containing protein [Chaetomidium leptoderma]
MWSAAWTLWTVAALCYVWSGHVTLVLCDEVPPGASQPGLVGVNASDPQYLVYEVRQLEVVLGQEEQLLGTPDTERHLKEKERLLQRLDKKQGTWNEHHPRHRLLEALRGFSAYAETQQTELDRLKGLYSHVSKKQKRLLEREVKYSHKFSEIAQLLHKNQQVCDDIVRNGMEFYGIGQQELDQHTQSMKAAGRAADRVSVSQALKHFVRDWAASGSNERDAAFPRILNTLKELFPSGGQEEEVKVLLPGAGLGRLGHEVAKLPGFQATNNEWSTYQNLAYRLLSHLPSYNTTSTIHPFIDSWSHHRSTADMLRPISFPEVPVDHSKVVLVEGDFTTAVFHNDDNNDNDKTNNQEGLVVVLFDVVVTHFFIDTARNLVSYFDTIARVLRPGGYWVNFGPLLYGTAPFVQLSLEEIVAVVEGMGFEFLEQREEDIGKATIPGKRVYGVEAVYGFDERALTRNAYEAQFWVARRG